jgi:hypothetical protein
MLYHLLVLPIPVQHAEIGLQRMRKSASSHSHRRYRKSRRGKITSAIIRAVASIELLLYSGMNTVG